MQDIIIEKYMCECRFRTNEININNNYYDGVDDYVHVIYFTG